MPFSVDYYRLASITVGYSQLLSFIIEPNTLLSIIALLLTQMWLAHSRGKGIMCELFKGGVNCCNYVALVINEWIWNIGRMTLTGKIEILS